ncbi:MAG: ATP-binding protein [Jatrophihabitans sp.]|nr:ATP-binding protein [Jatrophihabitans sp.]
MPHPMSRLIDSLANAALRRTTAAESGGGEWQWTAEFELAISVLKADHAGADEAEPSVHPLATIAEVFGLDEVDTTLLWLAAASDLDATTGLSYALLRGLAGAVRPSVGLALELAGVPTATPESFTRLGPDGVLRRSRLLEVSGSEPWLARVLSVPQSVTAVLAGGAPCDPDVSRLRTPVLPLALPGSSPVARAIEQGVPLTWVRSAPGSAGASLAAGAFDEIGLHCLSIDISRHLPNQNLADLLAAAAREAGLWGWGLLVIGAEVLAEPVDCAAFEILEQAAVPVVAVGARPWNPAWLTRFPFIVDAEPLSVTERAAIWRDSLGELADDDELRESLLGLRLTPEDVTEAARYARVLAATGDAPLSAGVVREAVRRIGGSGGSGADRISVSTAATERPGFDDLVLPEHTTAALHQLVTWARHRDEVAAKGPLRTRGRGIAALFTGGPGTGKTLAAHVIAEELSIDLFQVDLSAVVDKYIGETEKNLEKVFRAAEALDVVLFFDEADALFGSRSDVKDARDRYANQEVAYLLQRMEHFDGITILATNLRGNLDRAFSRRMSFIVHFPDPDPAVRRRLWEQHLCQLPALDEADPVNLDFLAESVDLAGGDIRNIVLGAAYDAVSAGELVGMRRVVEATVREYRKLGRVMPEHGFLPLSPDLPTRSPGTR